jgi:hypothetical protein
MKESYIEVLATHGGPGHALATREGAAKRWIRGARRRAMEPRKGVVRGADAVIDVEGNIAGGVFASRERAPRGLRTRACVRSPHAENREVSCSPVRVDDAPSWMVRGVACQRPAGREGNAEAVIPR